MDNIITDIGKISAKSNKTIKNIQNMDNFVGEGTKIKSKNKEIIDMIQVKKLDPFDSDDSDIENLDKSNKTIKNNDGLIGEGAKIKSKKNKEISKKKSNQFDFDDSDLEELDNCNILNKSDQDDGKNDYLKTIMKNRHLLNTDKRVNKNMDINSDSDASDVEFVSQKSKSSNSKQLVDISVIDKMVEDDDSDEYKELKAFNAKKTKQIDKIQKIEKSINYLEESVIPKLSNKTEFMFSKLLDEKKYFNYLNNIENKNNKLELFITTMKEIICERKIKDINVYLKFIASLINNYKMLFGYIVYIKDFDTRTSPEILDLFGIISNFISINIDIIENAGYVLSSSKKTQILHTVTTLSNEKKPIKYKNIETINNINVFVPIIKNEDFCYLNKYIVLDDVINTFIVTWNIILLHLLICSKMTENNENDIKKIRDKCLTIVTDTNVFTKQYLSFIKRKPKTNLKSSEKGTKTKSTKANNILVSDALNNANILKNNVIKSYDDIDNNEDNNLDMNDDNNLDMNDDD